MRVVALLAIRNEELYLEQCLQHLIAQGVDVCVIDNDSTDSSLQIANRHLGRGVFRIERLPYEGFFDETAKMRLKAALAQEIDGDWFIHHDADEIRQAPTPFRSLIDGITEVDRQGYNAINFDEFVFLPTDGNETCEGRDFVTCMKYYYFFEPVKLNRINAWKKTVLDERFVESGGHHISFKGMKIYPDSFILRHYMGLSQRHLLSKYTSRIHSMSEVLSQNLNRKRAMFTPDRLLLPTRAELKLVDPAGRWDRSDPWRAHKFLGGAGPASAIYRETGAHRTDERADEGVLVDELPHAPVALIVGADQQATHLLGSMLELHPEINLSNRGGSFGAALDRLNTGGSSNAAITDALASIFGPAESEIIFAPVDLQDNDQEPTLRQVFRNQASLECRNTGASLWGIRAPEDLFCMLDVQRLLPEACFIHVIRDGREALASRYPDPRIQIAKAEDEAIQWAWGIREARQQSQLLSCYVEVRFNELIVDPGRTMVRIWDLLGLKSGLDLDFHLISERDRWLDSNAASQESSVGNGTAVEGGVDLQARAIFETVAGPILRELGYVITESGAGRPY